MKKQLLFSLMALILLNISPKAQDNKANRYAVKSGHVEYKLTGNAEGTRSIWFDNYGDTWVEEKQTTTTVKMFGMKSVTEEHTLIIMNGAESITVDFIEGTAYKSRNPYYQDGKDFAESMTKEQQEEFANDIMNSLGGEIIGEETILGKKCEIMSMLGSKAWIYKGITLKSETKVLGVKNYEEAIKFEENIKFPASKLKVPEGFDVEDLTQQMNSYYGEYEEEVEEDYEEEESHQVEMPYEVFQKAVQDISIEGYNRASVMNLENEQYMAVFMKTMTQALTIIATSMEDADFDDKSDVVDEFKHNGRQMYHINTKEDGVTMTGVVAEYSKYNTLISIIATSELSKTELLKIFDDLKF